MNTDELAAAFASTRAVLAAVTPDQYTNATPCASWDVRALINHIVGGSHLFAAAARAGESGPPVEGPDFTAGDPVAAYDQGITASIEAFSDPEMAAKTINLPFGAVPAAAFMRLATTDTFTHGWDLARATGQSTDLNPELARTLLESARQMLPDTLRGADGVSPFAPAVDVPESALGADQLAGFLGRKV